MREITISTTDRTDSIRRPNLLCSSILWLESWSRDAVDLLCTQHSVVSDGVCMSFWNKTFRFPFCQITCSKHPGSGEIAFMSIAGQKYLALIAGYGL
jgi:hypothetical protein